MSADSKQLFQETQKAIERNNMEAIRHRIRIPKNREILIKVPQHIPEDGIAEIIILMNEETKKSKLNKLKDAMKDDHFLNDLNEIAEDYRAVDVAEWE